MKKQLAIGAAALLAAAIGYAEVRMKAAAASVTAEATAVASTARDDALRAAAPATNACVEQVQRLTVRLDLTERMLWETRGVVERLRASVLVRRNSAEYRARMFDPPLVLEGVPGPSLSANAPPSAAPVMPRIEVPAKAP